MIDDRPQYGSSADLIGMQCSGPYHYRLQVCDSLYECVVFVCVLF